jgi:hypothetical protein
MDRCGIPRCRDGASIVYLGRGVCERHWNKLAAEDAPPDALRMALGAEGGHRAAVEGRTVDDGQKASKSEQTEMPAKGKARTKPVKMAAKTEAKAPTQKPAKEKKPREREQFDGEVVVFAFRLGSNDRDRIHAAAGPAGATRFVRSAALAAASGDTKAFEALVSHAKSNLK